MGGRTASCPVARFRFRRSRRAAGARHERSLCDGSDRRGAIAVSRGARQLRRGRWTRGLVRPQRPNATCWANRPDGARGRVALSVDSKYAGARISSITEAGVRVAAIAAAMHDDRNGAARTCRPPREDAWRLRRPWTPQMGRPVVPPEMPMSTTIGLELFRQRPSASQLPHMARGGDPVPSTHRGDNRDHRSSAVNEGPM